MTQRKSSTWNARSRRSRVFRKANGRCFYCGNPVFERGCAHKRDWLVVRPSAMVAEHKVPLIRGGNDQDENIVCSCRPCNLAKAAFTVDEFRLVAGFRNGNLDYRFWGEQPAPITRDWLICSGSEKQQFDLVIHNMPSAAVAFGLRNGNARGPQSHK